MGNASAFCPIQTIIPSMTGQPSCFGYDFMGSGSQRQTLDTVGNLAMQTKGLGHRARARQESESRYTFCLGETQSARSEQLRGSTHQEPTP
jgi:hypothetical protein